MSRTKGFALVAGLAVFLAVVLSVGLVLETDLTATERLALILNPGAAETFDAVYFVHGTLPRLALAILGGAILGLAGAIMQSVTKNPLTSPMTLGASSGAWFAVVLVSTFVAQVSADAMSLAAFAGGLAAFGLVVAVTGLKRLTGLTLVVSGMVVNLLFGALSVAVLFFSGDFVTNVFLWGAGDMAQNGWAGTLWFAERAVPVTLLLLLFAPRAVALLSLGDEAAKARGLALTPVFFTLCAAALWCACALITQTGLINFVGLIAPNLVRALGIQAPQKRLWASAAAGAVLLLTADTLSRALSLLGEDVIPTGVVTALAGAPVFVLLAMRMKAAPALESASAPAVRPRVKTLTTLVGLALLAALFLARPDAWPRTLTAVACGAALSMAGAILQRLVKNPLASPDVLGVTSGATLGVVASALGLLPGLGTSAAAGLGAGLALALLLALSVRVRFAPANVIVIGIACAAFMDALATLFLSRASSANYSILQWLSATTYFASPVSALSAAGLCAAFAAAALLLTRPLTLLSVSRDFAASRGLGVFGAGAAALLLTAALAAVATAAMGPVAFVGLVAPHAARLTGAKGVKVELFAAALTGSALLAASDAFAQWALAPKALPAGTVAACAGAIYFLALIINERRSGRALA